MMSEQYVPVKASTLTNTVKLENAEEIQQLIEKASNLTNQLKETLQQIERFGLKS